MEIEVEISERDIFNFVFFEDLVSPEKTKFISGTNDFGEIINFYSSLKSALAKNIPLKIKNKIREKIPVYRVLSYKLFPLTNSSLKKKSSGLTLAADSPLIKSKMTNATFIDEEKHFLIKLLNFENSAKIFVFSTDDEIIKNYKIIIQPSNIIFEQTDNSQPILIDSTVEASSIELEFN